MEDKNNNKILALEARALLKQPDRYINHIYCMIRECAENGSGELDLNMDKVEKSVIDKVIKDLQESGYTVIKEFSDSRAPGVTICRLKVSW